MTAFNNYEDFIAARVQQLRSQKNISARKMSLSIGQNEGYITQIDICRYLEITPEEFFASDNQNPEVLRKMVEDIKTLTPGQIDSLNKTISEFKIANKFKKP